MIVFRSCDVFFVFSSTVKAYIMWLFICFSSLSFSVLPFNAFFLPLSQNRQQPLQPPENAGHDARGEEESLCCSLKDSNGSRSLLETAIILLHRPLERHPTDPHAFFVDIYKGFCSFLELQTLS